MTSTGRETSQIGDTAWSAEIASQGRFFWASASAVLVLSGIRETAI
jgi:hypothetical protein